MFNSVTGRRNSKRLLTTAFLLAAAVISIVGLSSYSYPRRLAHRSGSVTEALDRLASQTRVRVGSGKVLTLAPIIPLEAGLDIYPELVTGPFALRTAHLLDPVDRARFKMVSATDLEVLLRPAPPSAILVGETDNEDPLIQFAKRHDDEPLVQYAKRHDYVPLPISNSVTAWVPREPSREPEMVRQMRQPVLSDSHSIVSRLFPAR